VLSFVRNSNLEHILTKIPEPYIVDERDVKIRMEYCSLCRDDMRIEDNLNVFGKIGTIGHEGAGVIVELGKHAQSEGFNIGDRVIMQFIDSCGHCKSCLTQHPQFCPEAKISEGVLSEYIVRKCRQLIKIPDNLTFKQASIIEPVGDVIDAISRVDLDFQTDVLLLGAGFTGLVFIQLLKQRGVQSITVIEPLEERQKLALQYGADRVFSPSDDDLELSLMKATDFWGYDLAIDTSSVVASIEGVPPFLAAGGTLLIFTYSDLQDKLCFNSFNMYRKSLTLKWSCLSNGSNMKTAASIIKRLSLDQLITAEYPFSQSQKAYNSYLGRAEIKVGIRMR